MATMINMGDVWDRTVEFASDHLVQILPLAIFAILVPTSISGALQPLQINGDMPTRTVLAVAGLGFALLQLWGQLAIAALAIDPAVGRRASRIATARLLPAIGTYLALLLLLFVMLLPFFALVLMGGGVNLASLGTGQAAAMPWIRGPAGIYALVLTVVGVFFSARLLTLLAVVVAERRGAGAVLRSIQLTRGLTWKLIGVMILYAVVTVVATLAARLVFGSILRLVAGGRGPITVADVITAVVVAAVTTVFTVLGTAFTAKLYVAIMRDRERVAPPPPSVADTADML